MILIPVSSHQNKNLLSYFIQSKQRAVLLIAAQRLTGAIFGLLLAFFISSSWFLLRPYDVTTTSNLPFVHSIMQVRVWRHNHFKSVFFIQSCSFTVACVTSYLSLSGASFMFIRVIKFLVTRDLPHSKMTSWLWNWFFLQRDKVKWMCVTLNEGYLRAAKRGSNNLYRFLIKIWHLIL